MMQVLKVFSKKYVELYERLCPVSETFRLKKAVRNCQSILDVGCGEGTFSLLLVSPKNCLKVGVDIYKPYGQKAKIHYDFFVLANARSLPFKGLTFDCVVAAHLLEHLVKETGIKVIQEIERVAKKKIILILPNGFLRQDAYNGNPFQVHLSGWTFMELKNLGFKVHGVAGLKCLRGYLGRIRLRPAFFWRIISDASQFFTFWFPTLAAKLFCIKILETKNEDIAR
jgi:SAM-dependent methyltransferase